MNIHEELADSRLLVLGRVKQMKGWWSRPALAFYRRHNGRPAAQLARRLTPTV